MRILARIALFMLAATTVALADVPVGWGLSTASRGSYVADRDRTVFHSGGASGGLRSVGPVSSRSFGVLLQECGAADFRRKRLRMTGYIRTQDVTGWAGMMLRVDPQRGTALEFDNMQDRPIVGTTSWKRYEIELNVPQEGHRLSFGVILVGAGHVWLDDVTLEIVGPTVPGSRARQRVRAGGDPVNLDFERQ